MNALLRSELLKLRTVRTPRYTLLVVLPLVLFITGAAAATIPPDQPIDEGIRTVLGVTGGFLPALVVMILALLSVASEFHRGTIVPTYLVTPDRRRVLTAKLLVLTGLGAAVGLICSAATIGLATPITNGRGLDIGLTGTGGYAGLLAGCAAATALSAAIGVGVGACFRTPVAATVAVVGWASFGESLVGVVVPEPLLPFGAIRTAVAPTPQAPAWLAIALLAGYAVVALLLATRISLPRDVTV
jgi:ABC-2 type transport system permease protein